MCTLIGDCHQGIAGRMNKDTDEFEAFTFVPQQLPPPTLDDFRLVHRAYRAAFGRNPNLLRPRRFTEKIQWRKLFDLNPLYAVLSDKIAVRNFVASRVGDEWLPPLLWIGDTVTEIPFDSIKAPYILKCNHGSGLNVVVTDSARLDREKAQEVLRSGLAASFGRASREPGYVPIQPRLLAEQLMLERDGTPPLEHKIFVFDGRARVIWSIFVDQDRARFDAVYSRDWRPLHWSALNQPYKGILARPQQLEKFIELAERLGAGLDHVRVDFYEWNGQPMVGELTLYNLSGLYRFYPDEADFILGSWWKLRHPLRRALASTLYNRALFRRALPQKSLTTS
jgi:hypothetical protein